MNVKLPVPELPREFWNSSAGAVDLRGAGKVRGVAPDRPHAVTGTSNEAVQRMRMEALDAVQEGRAIERQGERTYPIGTVLWIEPKGNRNGLGAYDGGPDDGAAVKIKAGRYQYTILRK